MNERKYPILPDSSAKPVRPISFVVVHYSDEYFHNLVKSECVENPINQLIVVDNRQNVFFDNLSQAINSGIDQAEHELIAIVHEDVLFPQGWQQQFEKSLELLEAVDPNWGMVGSVGWSKSQEVAGHWSDPHRYRNSLSDIKFKQVNNLDEQLMVIRKSNNLRFDDFLPSIHNIGRDMASILERRGLKTYVIDAPTIHKYADALGELIITATDSPKIVDRQSHSYIAELECSNEYLFRKWPAWKPAGYEEEFYAQNAHSTFDNSNSEPSAEPQLRDGSGSRLLSFLAKKVGVLLGNKEPSSQNAESTFDNTKFKPPVILLSRGGSGSRLLSLLAQNAGVFLGNDVNAAGDCMDMVQAIYKGALTKHKRGHPDQKARIVPRIQNSANQMLEQGQPNGHWGFKLPENMLLLPELDQAFKNARFIHLIRDPLTTCLRRTHMTARFDNTIGRTAIPIAYKYHGRDVRKSLTDSPAVIMAYTTAHQIRIVQEYAQTHLPGRYTEVRFEDIMENPQQVLEETVEWLGSKIHDTSLADSIDPKRAAAASRKKFTPEIIAEVTEILAPLREELGY